MEVSAIFQPGLYKITCLKKNQSYIGHSENILGRLGRHTENLEKNRQDCQELQKDFNFYGKAHFVFEALKDVYGPRFANQGFREKYEQQLIQQTGFDFSYNKPISKNIQYFAQKVEINGVFYTSLRKAALILKESRTNISRKCLDPHNPKYPFIETSAVIQEDSNLKIKTKIFF